MLFQIQPFCSPMMIFALSLLKICTYLIKNELKWSKHAALSIIIKISSGIWSCAPESVTQIFTSWCQSLSKLSIGVPKLSIYVLFYIDCSDVTKCIINTNIRWFWSSSLRTSVNNPYKDVSSFSASFKVGHRLKGSRLLSTQSVAVILSLHPAVLQGY